MGTEHEDFLVWLLKSDGVTATIKGLIAQHLLHSESFDVGETIKRLEIDWWGDDPTGCSTAIRILVAEKGART